MNTAVNKKQIILIGAGVLVLLAALAVYFYHPVQQTPPTQENSVAEKSPYGKELSEQQIVDVTEETLNILHDTYVVTQDLSSGNNPDSSSALVMGMMTESLRDKSQLGLLIPRAQKLATSDNDVVQLIGKSMVVCFLGLSNAETTLVTFLRSFDTTNPNLPEFEYQISAYNASEKEAFKMMALGTGQLSSLFWKPAESEHPTGAIPYRISKENREKLLAEIDRLFKDDILADEENHAKTGNTNVVIFIVKSYIDNLKFDTYEESARAQASTK